MAVLSLWCGSSPAQAQGDGALQKFLRDYVRKDRAGLLTACKEILSGR